MEGKIEGAGFNRKQVASSFGGNATDKRDKLRSLLLSVRSG